MIIATAVVKIQLVAWVAAAKLNERGDRLRRLVVDEDFQLQWPRLLLGCRTAGQCEHNEDGERDGEQVNESRTWRAMY